MCELDLIPKLTGTFTSRPFAAPISAAGVSPCGGVALSGDVGGGIALWSLTDGRQLSAAGRAACARVSRVCWVEWEGCAGPVAATAAEGSSAVQLWSGADGQLKLVGELDGGSCRAATCLRSAGSLLAVGCADGSTLLWHARAADFQQLAMMGTTSQGAAVVALDFSRDGSLLAIATARAVDASPAVQVFASATGLAVCQHSLKRQPALLLWDAGGELRALLEDGTMAPLGAPHCEAGLPLQLRQLQRGSRLQAAPGPRGKQGKTVRFDAASTEGDTVNAWREHARWPLGERSQPTLHGQQTRSAGSTAAQPSRRKLPPLPSHPRLGGLSSAVLLDDFRGDSRRCCRNNPPAPTPPGAAPRASSAAHMKPVACSAGPNASQLQPLYPILDLRAMEGIPTMQARSGERPRPLPNCPAASGMPPAECNTTSMPEAQPRQSTAPLLHLKQTPGLHSKPAERSVGQVRTPQLLRSRVLRAKRAPASGCCLPLTSAHRMWIRMSSRLLSRSAGIGAMRVTCSQRAQRGSILSGHAFQPRAPLARAAAATATPAARTA